MPKWKKERERKFFVENDVTQIVVSGSRTSEIEAELFSADVDERRVTKHAIIAGSVHSEGNGRVHQKRSRRKIPIGGRRSLSKSGKQRNGGNTFRWRWSKFWDVAGEFVVSEHIQ